MVESVSGSVCMDNITYPSRPVSIHSGEELAECFNWRCDYRHDVTVYQSAGAAGGRSICVVSGIDIKVGKFSDGIDGFDRRGIIRSLRVAHRNYASSRRCTLWPHYYYIDHNRVLSVSHYIQLIGL